MKEHPILFSDAMVRAILDGTKTQTRRLVRPNVRWLVPDTGEWMVTIADMLRDCPYGVPGDRPWVKEAVTRDLYADTSHFRADSAPTKADAWPWKRRMLPGMFMPKGLQRITLELTDVRAERLQDITDEDARAEGCDAGENMREGSCRDLFSVLWDSINHKRAPWESNPWVWALTLKRVKP